MTNPHQQLYENCIREHSDGLYRLAYRLSGKPDLAQDLVQETFCEAWKSIASLSDPSKSKAWLFQILRFRWSHYLRDRSRRITAVSDHDAVAAMGSSKPSHVDRIADADHLQAALDRLEPDLKLPLLLVLMEDYTCQEAADALQIPLGTVLSRIHRAKITLRKLLSNTP